MKEKIYLDDVRTPVDESWIVVRNYQQFVRKINKIGLENIELISLDHDLGPSAMDEWYNNVYPNGILDYNNITEKTGMDCAKWLVKQWQKGKPVVNVRVHSANVIGCANMTSYINTYRKLSGLNANCVVNIIPHTIDDNLL
jgi:hypothetical protein